MYISTHVYFLAFRHRAPLAQLLWVCKAVWKLFKMLDRKMIYPNMCSTCINRKLWQRYCQLCKR